MKKSLLLTSDFPPRVGGTAEYYRNICQFFPRGKIVVAAPQVAADEDFDLLQQYPVIRMDLVGSNKNRVGRTLHWLRLAKYLKPLIASHHIEMLQVGQILPLGSVALMIKKKLKLPFMVYAHGMDITVPKTIPRKRMLLKKILTEAEVVVANSFFTKDQIVELGIDRHKIIVVHPCSCLEPELPSPEDFDRLEATLELKDKQVVLGVGRLVERKGFDTLIVAMKTVVRHMPNAVLVIAGDGPDRQRLKKIVNTQSLGEHVRLAGKLEDIHLKILYERCDVFAMPSRQLPNGDVEGFGIVFLEANSFGKPVIGGRSGGVPEAILDRKTGIVVDPNSSADTAQAIIELLSDKTLATRLGMQGMSRVHSDFNWQKQTEKIIAALQVHD